MLLKIGMTSNEVKTMQEKLMWIGYDMGGSATGYFGMLHPVSNIAVSSIKDNTLFIFTTS